MLDALVGAAQAQFRKNEKDCAPKATSCSLATPGAVLRDRDALRRLRTRDSA